MKITSILHKDLLYILKNLGLNPIILKAFLLGAKLETFEQNGNKIILSIDKEAIFDYGQVTNTIYNGSRQNASHVYKKLKILSVPKENIEMLIKFLEERNVVCEEACENLENSFDSVSLLEENGVSKETLMIEDLTVAITKDLIEQFSIQKLSNSEQNILIKQYLKELFNGNA
jgi:hypothetical protein